MTLQKAELRICPWFTATSPTIITVHRWQPDALTALPGNGTVGALPHLLQMKSTRCAQTHNV